MSLSSEAKVGFFTVLGIFVLSLTAVILGGNPFSSQKQHFYTILNNVKGVAGRTQVRSSGTQVGEVTSVEILPKGARINFAVDAQVKIPVGSFIEIRSRGILGDVYIEIIRNMNTLEEMKSGDLLPQNPESNDMDTLLMTLNSIARDVKRMSGSLAEVLAPEKGSGAIKNIIQNIESITHDLKELTVFEKSNLQALTQNLLQSSIRISALLERNDTKIDHILSDIQSFTKELRLLSTKENRGKIEKIIANLNDSTSIIKNLSLKIEKGEGSLGQFIAKDEAINEVKTTLKSLQTALGPLSSLKLSVQDRGEFRLKNAQKNDKFFNEFNMVFSTRSDRFYLLGLTTAPYGRKVTNTTTTPNDSGTSVNVQENVTENTGLFRFNLQMSQRFGFLGVRLGMFASSPGFATDVYLFHDKMVGVLEFSKFGGSPIPSDQQYGPRGAFNLKAYANIFFTPNVFLTGGIDGFILNKNPFPFIGGGIFITDEDLKGLIGVAASTAVNK